MVLTSPWWSRPARVARHRPCSFIGIRRRRERTLAGAYELGGVRTIEDLVRITEIVVFDVLGPENGIAKARVLLQAVMAGAKLIEAGDLEARIAALEARDAGDDTAG